MADYMVGKGSGKDRYMVGWTGQTPYKVGGGKSSVGSSSNASLGGGDQASPAGQKSAFSYKDIDTKDVGDRSPNMNMGGAISTGTKSDPTGPGGQIDLTYSEKGDWSVEKDAMARRKAMMEASSKYYSKNTELNSPRDDAFTFKK